MIASCRRRFSPPSSTSRRSRPNVVLRPRLIRTAGRGFAEQADPGICPGWLRQDHDRQRVGGRLQSSRTGGSTCLAFPGRTRQRSGALPGLPRRRAADGCDGCRARSAGHAPVSSAATNRIDADGSAQRDRGSPARVSSSSSTTTMSSTPNRWTRLLAFLLEHLPPQLHVGHRHPGGPTSSPGPVAGSGPTDRAARGRSAFRALRSRRVPQPGDGPRPLDRRHHRAWRSVPRAGSPACSWRRSPSKRGRMPPASSKPSPAATASCSTTWSRRFFTANHSARAASCCRPPSSTRCAVLCAMPSPARSVAKRCSSAWSATTCSSSRLTTTDGGIAITTSSPMSCRRTCSRSNPISCRLCTDGRAEWYEENGSRSDAIRHALLRQGLRVGG